MGLQLLYLCLALLILAVLTAAEVAFSHVPKSQLKTLKNSKRMDCIVTLLGAVHLMPILRGCIILLTMTLAVVSQNIVGELFVKLFKLESTDRMNALVSMIPMALIILIFAVFLPYIIARNYPLKIASYLAKPILYLYRFSKPLTCLFDWMTGHVLGDMVNNETNSHKELYKPELLLLIKNAVQNGSISALEGDCISNSLKLSERGIGSMMTPRTEMCVIDINDTPETVLKKINDAPHSRYPVINGQLEKNIGIISIKDLMNYVLAPEDKRKPISDYIVKTLAIPDSVNALDVLQTFKNTASNLAVVFDEYGNITGVITLYDLLETITGGFMHKSTNMIFTSAHTPSEIKPQSDGSVLLDGSMDIADFFEVFGMQDHLQEMQEIGTAYSTLAGFVLRELQHIPQPSEVLIYRNLRIEVIVMDKNRIAKLHVSRIPEDNDTSVVSLRSLAEPKQPTTDTEKSTHPNAK